MNKKEFVIALAEKIGKSKSETEEIVASALDVVIAALKKDAEGVQFVGFGTLRVKERKARMGRNPKTGQTIKIPASRAVTFKAGKLLKDKI